MKTIRLLVVDDSPFVCKLVSGYFTGEADINVVGQAGSGREALEKVKRLNPDVITMDLEMPDTDGLGALERIMQDCPTPIIALSGVSGASANLTLRALELGAVDFVLKYAPGVRLAPNQLRREIIAKVRAAAQTRVVRLRRSSEPVLQTSPAPRRAAAAPPALSTAPFTGLLVIGASTGGPVALRALISRLPVSFPLCILIVQHMPAGFTSVFAEQLAGCCPLPVREAREGDPLRGGQIYVAPGGSHLLVTPGLRMSLQPVEGQADYCPSIDVTMESAAGILGPRVTGVILTGMGSDGARGMAAIHAVGGDTYAQDSESCVIDSMPRHAIERSAAAHVAPPHEIARMLAAAATTRELQHAG